MLALTVATATAPRTTFVPMGTAKKTRNGKIERDERLRAVLKELEVQCGSTAELARRMKVSGPAITEILGGSRGVGLDMMVAMADYTGQTLDALMGRPAKANHLAALPQWPKARVEAEKRLAHLRPEIVSEALDRVGRFVAPETAVALTGLFVAKLAEAVIASPDQF